MVAMEPTDSKPPTPEPGTPTPRPKVLFPLGETVATTGALAALARRNTPPQVLLARHHSGDWGDIDPEDQGLNEEALQTGTRIFSVYKLSEAVTVWVITEADRRSTTLLLPSEY